MAKQSNLMRVFDCAAEINGMLKFLAVDYGEVLSLRAMVVVENIER